MSKKGFTLVELIVVITILAILGTIVFISLQWYSENARDSRRVADINNIKKALELFVLNTEIYPMPDEVWAASYSWAEIYYQWVLWANVTQNLSRNLKGVPRDPVTEDPYIYSVTENQFQYEVTVVYESSIWYSPVPQTHADLSEWIVAIGWNYNGLYVQTDDYAVPLPSITTAETLPVVLTTETIQSQMTAWWTNRPSVWWAPAQTWTLDISLSVYEWKIDIDSSNVQKIAFMHAVQAAYSWSSLAQWWSIYEEVLSKTSGADIVGFVNGAIASSTSEPVPEVLQCWVWMELSWDECVWQSYTFWGDGNPSLPSNATWPLTAAYNWDLISWNLWTINCDAWYAASTIPNLGYYFNSETLVVQGTCSLVVGWEWVSLFTFEWNSNDNWTGAGFTVSTSKNNKEGSYALIFLEGATGQATSPNFTIDANTLRFIMWGQGKDDTVSTNSGVGWIKDQMTINQMNQYWQLIRVSDSEVLSQGTTPFQWDNFISHNSADSPYLVDTTAYLGEEVKLVLTDNLNSASRWMGIDHVRTDKRDLTTTVLTMEKPEQSGWVFTGNSFQFVAWVSPEMASKDWGNHAGPREGGEWLRSFGPYTGTARSPNFVLSRTFLQAYSGGFGASNFATPNNDGRQGAVQIYLRDSSDDSVLSTWQATWGDSWYNTKIDISAHVGKTVHIYMDDTGTNGLSWIGLDYVRLTDN